VVVGGDLFVFGDDTGVPNSTLAPPPRSRGVGVGVSSGEKSGATDAGGVVGATSRGSDDADDACSSKELGALPACVGVEKAGDAGGCRAGTMYAATSLLRSLGVRWVWPGDDGVVVPDPNASKSLSGAFAHRAAPQLTLRRLRPNPLLSLDWGIVGDALGGWFNATLAMDEVHAEAMWMLRNGLGGRQSVPWGQAFMTSWQEYGATHPEWFALHPDGTRGCQNMTDCNNNPALVKIDATNAGLATHVASLLQPGDLGVSACEDDDNHGFCTCDKCRALDPPERVGTLGALSDRCVGQFTFSILLAFGLGAFSFASLSLKLKTPHLVWLSLSDNNEPPSHVCARTVQ
jgi:hypothetical protein